VKRRPSLTLSILSIVAVTAIFVLAVLFMIRWRQSQTITCEDGERRTIDMNDFATQYFSYAVEWQAEIKDQAKFAGKLTPVQLQQMSDSLQSANEFRKTLVAAYNSCAIKKADFEKYANRFQVLDGLAREISALTATPSLAVPEGQRLQKLTDQYISVSRSIASE
jgi:hypothetical protein